MSKVTILSMAMVLGLAVGCQRRSSDTGSTSPQSSYGSTSNTTTTPMDNGSGTSNTTSPSGNQTTNQGR